MTKTIKANELKELQSKATQGEWGQCDEGSYALVSDDAETQIGYIDGVLDLDFIVALANNALPIIDALEEENKRLREALEYIDNANEGFADCAGADPYEHIKSIDGYVQQALKLEEKE